MSEGLKISGTKVDLVLYDLQQQDESRRYLAIYLGEKVIGYVHMTQVDLNMKKGCFSVELTDADERNKGYGTEAVSLTKQYAFQTLGLNLLATIASAEDKISCHVLEKQGFVCFEEREGCRYYLAGAVTRHCC